jgi:hypothetical protein
MHGSLLGGRGKEARTGAPVPPMRIFTGNMPSRKGTVKWKRAAFKRMLDFFLKTLTRFPNLNNIIKLKFG